MGNKKLDKKIDKRVVDQKFDTFINFLERALGIPEIFPEEVVILPLTNEEWKILFTERRIELVKTITNKRPRSVNGLAKLLKRHQEAVSRDLKYLENIGVVKIEQNGKNRTPSINKKLIVTPLLVPIKMKN